MWQGSWSTLQYIEKNIRVWEVRSNRSLEKTASRRASRFVLLDKYYSGDQIKVVEVGGACGMQGEKMNACRFLMERY
jgi:hypothetical protein